MSKLQQEHVVCVIRALFRIIFLKNTSEFRGFLSLNITLGNAYCVYALFLKLFDVIFEVIIYVFAKELLDDSQIAFVVDFDARLKSLERLDNLDSDPVILVFKFSNNAFFKSLETSLFEYSQHAIVPDFELEAIRIRELQL